MNQDDVFHILKTSAENIYLGGQPGTGKSYLVSQYLDWATDNGKRVMVTASTGIAAANIQGITLHSYLGLRDDKPLDSEDLDEIAANNFTRKRILNTDVLVIDEISMVSAQLLTNADMIMRAIADPNRPFGGIRVIVVGDFYQLPPVKGAFAFKSPTWNEAQFKHCLLTHVYRQSEQTFLDILQSIRVGTMEAHLWKTLKGRITDDVSGLDCIRIETHNASVDQINDRKLKLLPGTPHAYEMTSGGNEKLVQGLKKNCLSPEVLLLKEGAKVMFTQNDVRKQQYVNGTQGTIVSLNNTTVSVQTLDGVLVEVERARWEFAVGYGERKEVLAHIKQFPLRLAYAITIHKSQGCTFDRAVIDLTRVFECGQAYVALSRIRTLDGLYLQGQLTDRALAVHGEVIDFYEGTPASN